jgi:hypothetical protein
MSNHINKVRNVTFKIVGRPELDLADSRSGAQQIVADLATLIDGMGGDVEKVVILKAKGRGLATEGLQISVPDASDGAKLYGALAKLPGQIDDATAEESFIVGVKIYGSFQVYDGLLHRFAAKLGNRAIRVGGNGCTVDLEVRSSKRINWENLAKCFLTEEALKVRELQEAAKKSGIRLTGKFDPATGEFDVGIG